MQRAVTVKELKQALASLDDERVIVLEVQADETDPPEASEDCEARGAVRSVQVTEKNDRQFDGEDRNLAVISVVVGDF